MSIKTNIFLCGLSLSPPEAGGGLEITQANNLLMEERICSTPKIKKL
jgi:hypothetical protein